METICIILIIIAFILFIALFATITVIISSTYDIDKINNKDEKL